MKKTILKNIFSKWFAYAVIIIVTLIMTPIMLRCLGTTGYGIWLLINSLTGYLGLFDMGLSSSTTKYVAEFMGKKDLHSLNKLLSTTFIVFSTIAFIALCTTVSLASLTNILFKVPQDYRGIAPYLVVLVGSEISISFVFAPFVQVFSGMQRYEVHAAVDTVSLLVRSSLILFLLKIGHGLLSIALATFLVSLLGKIFYLLFLNHLSLGLEIRARNFDKNILKLVLKYSTTTFIIAVTSRVKTNTGNIIIGAFVSMSSISEYGIASRLVQYVVALVSNATDVLMPAASHEQINDQHKIRKMALYSSKFTSILVVPIVFGFFIIGDSFIYLWLGKGFTQTYLILVILTTAHMFALPLYGMGAMLFGIAKHAILAKIIVWEAVMNLILSLFFVRYWGIIGVALGTVLPATFFNLFIVPWKVKKILELDMRKYYSTCLIKPYIMAIPFSITLLCYKNTIGCNTWLQLIGGVSSSLCVYAATVYHFDIKTLVHEKYGSIQNAFFLLRSHRK